MINRRTLIGSAAGTMAGAMMARTANASIREFQPLPPPQDERHKMLVTTAVDAAKSAGANYADARLTFSQEMTVLSNGIEGGLYMRPINRNEHMAFGVRARCDGYWGFASSTVWTKDEAARLGRMAVDSAKANFSAKIREIELAPNPDITSGDWVMPVVDDPFAMDFIEISDHFVGLTEYLIRLRDEYIKPQGHTTSIGVNGTFNRQLKIFSSTDGQFVSQRVYRTGGNIGFGVDRHDVGGSTAGGTLRQFNALGAGAGFELLRHPNIREWCRELFEELAEEALLPWIPVDIGRFDCLVHPHGVAPIVKRTIGIATEIDRVMGFEANTTGTSYITDPNQELGSLKIGSQSLNVTATRALPGGLGHVKWDDEGVSPRDVALVKKGVLTNLQTGREGTAWMKDYLKNSGQPVLSSGNSNAIDAHEPQSIRPSDLILHPDATQDTSLAQLREQIDNGLEFKAGNAMMDYQQSTGMLVNSFAFQIKKGKRVARVMGPGVLFRTPELWGNLIGVGGPASSLRVGTADFKSNRTRMSYSTVDTPPVLLKEMSVINPANKA